MTSRNQYATILSGDLDIEKDIWDVSQLDVTKKREFGDSGDHNYSDNRTYGNRKQAREKIKTYTKRGSFASTADKSVRDTLRDNKEHLSDCIRTSEKSTTIGSRWIKMKEDDPRRKYEMYKTGFKWKDMGTTEPTSGTELTNATLGTELGNGKRLFIQSEFDGFFATAAAEPILDNWIKSGSNYYKPTNDGVSLTINDSDLTNLLKSKTGSYLEKSNKAAYILNKNVDIYNSDEFIIVDTTASSLTTTGWAYYDYYLDGTDVWILSRSKEEERKYIRAWEKNTRELRKRCIRIFESGASAAGHIWIKMKLDDPRRKEQHGDTQVTLNTTTHKDLIAFLTTNKGPIITGETGYVLDSIINPETNNIITYGTEYVLDELPVMPAVAYYNYFKPNGWTVGDDVWVVSKSKEEERAYMRVWEKDTRELRKRCIRKRERGAFADVKGHIWIKMKKDDPRRKEYHGGVKITHDDTTHADLKSFLKETPTGLSGSTGYVVDSIINPDTHKIMTYGTEYVLDTLPAAMPAIANYYDWYEPTGWQTGQDIWVVSKSKEEERAYMRVWEKDTRELRKRCIRKRERGAFADVKGHIWIKMKKDDPRRKEYHGGVKITHDDTTHADLVNFLQETPTGNIITGETGYVVDSIINPDTHKIITYGTEYVLDTTPTAMPTITNYYDWYEPTNWQAGQDIWVVSKSKEEERAYMRAWETNTRELRKRCIRKRERGALADVKGHIWIKMKSDDPRLDLEALNTEVSTHMNATLVAFLTTNSGNIITNETGYVVDSIINSDTHKIITYGTEYVLDEGCADIPTAGNVDYLDYYDGTDESASGGVNSVGFKWIVSKSSEEERVDIRTAESGTEAMRASYRTRETSDVTQGGLRAWQEDANRIGRRWIVRTAKPSTGGSELSKTANSTLLAGLETKRLADTLGNGDTIDLTRTEFMTTYGLDPVFTELYKMGRRWLVKDNEPSSGTKLDSTTYAALLTRLSDLRGASAEDTKLSLTSAEFNDTHDLDLVTFDIQFGTYIGPDSSSKYYLAGRGGDAWIGPETTSGTGHYFESTEGTQTNYRDYINFPGNDGGTGAHPS